MTDSEFLSNALWSDLKTDMERANWLLLGRGYETGVVAKAIQNELAMAYSRLASLSAAQPVAQPVVDQKPASMSDNGSCGSQVSGKPASAEARMLRELLARIHRDGGHYVAQHGLDKAVEDADRIVSDLLAREQENTRFPMNVYLRNEDELWDFMMENLQELIAKRGIQLPRGR